MWRTSASAIRRPTLSAVAVTATCLLGALASGGAWGQGAPGAQTPSAPAAQGHLSTAAPQTSGTPEPAAGGARAPRHPPPERFAGRAGKYYRMVWGVDSLVVQWAESGDVIKFTYHVIDAKRAVALGDKKYEPSLEDPQAGVKLVVPDMENIGKLRQSVPPESDKSYWVVFSNKGRLVKRGHRVNVVIGPFRADNLVVD